MALVFRPLQKFPGRDKLIELLLRNEVIIPAMHLIGPLGTRGGRNRKVQAPVPPQELGDHRGFPGTRGTGDHERDPALPLNPPALRQEIPHHGSSPRTQRAQSKSVICFSGVWRRIVSLCFLHKRKILFWFCELERLFRSLTDLIVVFSLWSRWFIIPRYGPVRGPSRPKGGSPGPSAPGKPNGPLPKASRPHGRFPGPGTQVPSPPALSPQGAAATA